MAATRRSVLAEFRMDPTASFEVCTAPSFISSPDELLFASNIKAGLAGRRNRGLSMARRGSSTRSSRSVWNASTARPQDGPLGPSPKNLALPPGAVPPLSPSLRPQASGLSGAGGAESHRQSVVSKGVQLSPSNAKPRAWDMANNPRLLGQAHAKAIARQKASMAHTNPRTPAANADEAPPEERCRRTSVAWLTNLLPGSKSSAAPAMSDIDEDKSQCDDA
eukprot:gnl/TRDRNA2_/TRDRNA2_160250_c3_seq1.p1 gnl/TRDRNA2_/TRDRNA2_160250_c3~~gnl/TRDRNA2_/TRDRNA2_160250_c3_seq1.p1  ORF type:complete len:247 (-),score=34.82 gnl/TRDRNA2_/TRDRNA2_160250_c3_seq1:46-708(-)